MLSLSQRRVPELDGIRGIAIAMVLAHHYFLLPLQTTPGTLLSYLQAAGRLAWSGVDLFFVLSGFLIGGILLDARHSQNYFRVFYTRRLLRIVPIYAVCLAGAFALTAAMSLGAARGLTWIVQDKLPWVPYLVFLQNFWMAKASTYGLFGLSVTWSLAIEEQFYLTLPVLVRKLSQKRLLQTILLGIVMAPTLRIVLHAFWPDHIYSWVVLMPCRADALLLGVLGAMAVRDSKWRVILTENRGILRFFIAVLAAGFAYLTLRAANPYGTGMLTFGFTLIAAFYLSILLYGLTFRESWTSQCLRWGYLGWLGSIAYGVYLLHEFVRAAFFGLIWSRPPAISSMIELCVSALALAVTLVICQLSWTYFEKPLLKRGHRVRYQSVGEQTTVGNVTLSAEGSGI